jgi:hypothetical protein
LFNVDLEKAFHFKYSQTALAFAVIYMIIHFFFLLFNKRSEKAKELYENESKKQRRFRTYFLILYLLSNPAFVLIAFLL